MQSRQYLKYLFICFVVFCLIILMIDRQLNHHVYPNLSRAAVPDVCPVHVHAADDLLHHQPEYRVLGHQRSGQLCTAGRGGGQGARVCVCVCVCVCVLGHPGGGEFCTES